MSPAFLNRYRSGEYEQVWADLLELGDRVRQEPVFSDALAVARETMTRARANLDILIPRLDALGFRFQMPRHPTSPLELAVRNPPPPDAPAQVDEIDRLIGPIPLSLRAWYEIVGGVCLVGRREGWPGIVTADPLEVRTLASAVADGRTCARSMGRHGHLTLSLHLIATRRPTSVGTPISSTFLMRR